jgi:hypothetical protein
MVIPCGYCQNMSSQAYKDWVADGRPWKKARPIADVEKWARANGVPVLGTIGDNRHLTKDRPEDHTPFSSTAWPDDLPGYWVCAIDLEDESGLEDAILEGARAGNMPWLKYANLHGRNYHCRDGFKSSTDSSDDNHIHLSARSDHLDTALAADWINHKPGGKPSKPAEGAPAPGPDVAFPLDADHWFGADDGTDRSHAGLGERKTNGKLDRTWIKTWASQLGNRGWSIGKGKTWLNRYGNDGKFGDEYDALTRAFQRDQGLSADAQVGPRTWNAAYDNPVT